MFAIAGNVTESSQVTQIFSQLIYDIHNFCITVISFSYYSSIYFCFQGKYHGNPMHIAVIISNCLREERRILAAASMPVQVTYCISLICLSHVCPYMMKPLVNISEGNI